MKKKKMIENLTTTIYLIALSHFPSAHRLLFFLLMLCVAFKIYIQPFMIIIDFDLKQSRDSKPIEWWCEV